MTVGRSSDFFGREQALARLRRSLSGKKRLVTVVGPAGVGKTRLARELTHRHSGDHRFGHCFADLSAARSLEDVIASVAAALEAPLLAEAGIDAAAGELERLLRARGDLLLVLDNFEQLVPVAADTIAQWVAGTRSLRILATSRIPLGIEKERLFELAPLEEDAGVELLLERGRWARADLGTDDAGRSAAREIVQQLDGLPLAIELAAARLRVLSLPMLAERLSSRLDLLRTGEPGVAPRQATMRAAIDWSWELLDAREQRALTRCSVFRGDFSLRAFEAVSGDIGLEVVESLCEHQLVQVHQPPGDRDTRFRLFECIREYGEEKLQALDEVAAARREHVAHFRALAETCLAAAWESGSWGPFLEEVQRELENLRAAFAYAGDGDAPAAADITLALDRYLLHRGPFALRARLLDEALSAPHAPAVQARLRAARAALRYDLCDYEGAREDAQAVPEDAEAAPRVDALNILGMVAESQGAWESSRAHYEAALACAEAAALHQKAGRILNNLALSASGRGEDEVAISSFRRAIEIAQRHGPRHNAGTTRINLGHLFHHRGRLAEARSELEAAARACDEVGENYYGCFAQISLALLALHEDRAPDAASHIDRARRLDEGLGDPRMTGVLEAVAGAHSAAEGRLREAEDSLREARRLLEASADQSCLDMLELLEGCLEVASAVGVPATESEARLESARDRVRRFEARPENGELLTPDAGATLALLRATLERTEQQLAQAQTMRLEIAPGAARFRVGNSPEVDLSRRPGLRRILEALVEARLQRAGTPVSVPEIQECGWPGEALVETSGARRVYVAISTLRKMGLGALIQREEGGYLLDPRAIVVRVA